MKTTKGRLESVMRELREVGYNALDANEKAICDAFDAGTLNIVSPNEMLRELIFGGEAA